MPDWEEETRFFLPNEDARIPVAAINALGQKPENCLFVTGSGILAFAMLSEISPLPNIKCVDLSPFQKNYFEQIKSGIQQARNASDFNEWFCETVLPALNSHYQKRGQTYTKENILHALKNFFHIDFFFKDEALAKVQAALKNITAQTADIVRASASEIYDFIHLSNVPDYLNETQLEQLFQNCSKKRAAIFFITTTTCKNEDLIKSLAKINDYKSANESTDLTSKNRGLGALKPERPWMRPGRVWFLIP